MTRQNKELYLKIISVSDDQKDTAIDAMELDIFCLLVASKNNKGDAHVSDIFHVSKNRHF